MVDQHYVYLPYVHPIPFVNPLVQGLLLLEVGPNPLIYYVLVLILELNYLPGYGGKILPVKFSKVVDHVLVNQVGKVQHLNVLVIKLIYEVRYFYLFNDGSFKEVYLVLSFLHPLCILGERYVTVQYFSLLDLYCRILASLFWLPPLSMIPIFR